MSTMCHSILKVAVLVVWAPTLAGGHCEGTTLVDTYGYALLEDSRDIPDITLRSISIKFCLMRNLDIQIWRQAGGNLFTLEWSLRITPRTLEEDIVHNIPAPNWIRLRPSDHRLGLYVPNRQDLPIFAKWGPGVHQTFYSELDGPFSVNQTYAFMTDLVNPIAFDITLCSQPGCRPDVPRPTRPVSTSTTTQPTTIPPLVCNSLNRRAGGRALLESSRPLPGGILKGVRVRSCVTQPYLLQIWEYAGTAGYTLVWQRWVVPRSGDGSIHVVLFNIEEYLVSSETYRAGIHLDQFVTLSVPETQRGPDPMLLESRVTQDFFSPCRSVNFRPASFIWDLALDFCTTPDCSPSNDIEDYLPFTSPCPTDPPFVVVTSSTTTTTSPTTTVVTSPTTVMTSATTMMTSPTTIMRALPTNTMTMSPTTTMTSPTTTTTSPTTRMTSPTTMIPTMIITDRPTTPSTTGMVSERTSNIPTRITDATTQMPSTGTTKSSVNPALTDTTSSTVTTSTVKIATTETTSGATTPRDTTSTSSSMQTEVTVMTTPMKTTMVTDATSIIPTTQSSTSPITTTTTTPFITTRSITTKRPKTVSPTTRRITTTTKATTMKATTQKPTTTTRPKTTTQKVVKPTRSQNNIVKNTNAKAVAASGSNNGCGIHSNVPIGALVILGILNCLITLPCLL